MPQKFSSTSKIMIAAVLGILVGLILKENASPLGDLGKLIIQFIKMIASPLLFLIIVQSIIKSKLREMTEKTFL